MGPYIEEADKEESCFDLSRPFHVGSSTYAVAVDGVVLLITVGLARRE